METPEVEVSPGEDLMQEHGLIDRVLLVYDQCSSLLISRKSLDLDVVIKAADVIRRFGGGYHAKLEEEYIFPRLQERNLETPTVTTLVQQHQWATKITEAILGRARVASNLELFQLLQKFTTMYRPHTAREETIIFPAFRTIVSPEEYEALGELFEQKEKEQFGDNGFQELVDEVSELERVLGIYDLSDFTPTST